MKVLFRVDASVAIGSGHIMRCLTLAHALKKLGAECHFACATVAGNLITLLQQAGFNTFSLPANLSSEQADAAATLSTVAAHYHLLVIDHYQLGKKYGQLLRQSCQKIMVIDDLANRPLDCDLLLDQNLYADMQDRYALLVPTHCVQLLGPRYALLRDEFYLQHAKRTNNHILISFGGSDEQNLTTLVIKIISELKSPPISADIVIGANNPWRNKIEPLCSQLSNVELHIQTNNMAALMQKAQIMVGTGGATHWERCISGLPALVITVADNQQATTDFLNKLGACIWLGKNSDITEKIIREKLCYYLQKPQLLELVAESAKNVIPINAGTPLVIEQLLNLVA